MRDGREAFPRHARFRRPTPAGACYARGMTESEAIKTVSAEVQAIIRAQIAAYRRMFERLAE